MPKRDVERKEEKWGTRNESYMRHIKSVCETKSNQHDQAGYIFKRKNNRWRLPLVLLPTAMSPISVLIENSDASKYVTAAGFMLTGILGGVVNFYKFGEKMSEHFNYSARFADVKTDIEIELVKERPYREAFDTFSTKIHMRIDSLMNGAPILPKSIANDTAYTPTGFDYKHFKTIELPPLNPVGTPVRSVTEYARTYDQSMTKAPDSASRTLPKTPEITTHKLNKISEFNSV